MPAPPDDVTAEKLRAGDRRALARAITLFESRRTDDRAAARALSLELLGAGKREALRIGVSGPPGAGKSSFLESFGLALTRKGQKIAVLAVDPSSKLSGGSILGDKTRMGRLLHEAGAYIRPSPAANMLGGVSEAAKDCVFLFEQADYDVVMVETVGVGQSELDAADLCDVFLLVTSPAGGDELQGVKRGIFEFADLVLVNKSDGELKEHATRAAAEYSSALRLRPARDGDPPGFPKVAMVSAAEETGLEEVWNDICVLRDWRKRSGFWVRNRQAQEAKWFRSDGRAALLSRLEGTPDVKRLTRDIECKVTAGELDRHTAVKELVLSVRKLGIVP